MRKMHFVVEIRQKLDNNHKIDKLPTKKKK